MLDNGPSDAAEAPGNALGRLTTAVRSALQAPTAALQELRVANEAPAELLASTITVVREADGREEATVLPWDVLRISASYHNLRIGMAVLAMLFPVLLVLVGGGIGHAQDSLSAYYHFAPDSPELYGGGAARNIFVGALCAIGCFLVLYRGYTTAENWAMNIAGLAAILIAFSPMDWPVLGPEGAQRTVTGTIHYAAACVFFLMLFVACRPRIQRSLEIMKDETMRKRFAATYRILGVIFLLVPAVPIVVWLVQGMPKGSSWVFWFEVLGVVVFALFWLVKTTEIWLIEREGRRRREGA